MNRRTQRQLRALARLQNRSPELSSCSPGRHGSPRRVFQRDDVSVVVDEHRREVVTVLLRTPLQHAHGVHTRRHLPGAA